MRWKSVATRGSALDLRPRAATLPTTPPGTSSTNRTSSGRSTRIKHDSAKGGPGGLGSIQFECPEPR